MTRSARQVQLQAYPEGEITAGHFRTVEVALGDTPPGGVLVRNTWTSVDPALRLRMRAGSPPGYFPAFPLHAALDGILTVGEVVESRADGFAEGDVVLHAAGWRDLAIVEAGAVAMGGLGTLSPVDADGWAPELYLGPLGAMGLTAYVGLFEIAGLRDGDIVWVSAAAGAVGSLAVQIARLCGHRVIGSAGTAEKVAYLLDELGADAAFDYRAGPVADLLGKAAPDGIDVYFDNVGGDHLEAALSLMRPRGRIAMCGAISQYEQAGSPRGPRNLFQVTSRELTIRGFRASNHAASIGEMRDRLAGWLASGQLTYRQTVVEGLEHAPDALVRMLHGDTVGKTIVRIA